MLPTNRNGDIIRIFAQNSLMVQCRRQLSLSRQNASQIEREKNRGQTKTMYVLSNMDYNVNSSINFLHMSSLVATCNLRRCDQKIQGQRWKRLPTGALAQLIILSLSDCPFRLEVWQSLQKKV